MENYIVVVTENGLNTSTVYKLQSTSRYGVVSHLYWWAAQYEKMNFRVDELIQDKLHLIVTNGDKSIAFQAFRSDEIENALAHEGSKSKPQNEYQPVYVYFDGSSKYFTAPHMEGAKRFLAEQVSLTEYSECYETDVVVKAKGAHWFPYGQIRKKDKNILQG